MTDRTEMPPVPEDSGWWGAALYIDETSSDLVWEAWANESTDEVEDIYRTGEDGTTVLINEPSLIVQFDEDRFWFYRKIE